jgi:two-component system, OmpR family, sensor kinase
LRVGKEPETAPQEPRDQPSYEELAAELREMRAALRARDEFLSMAAHELRNPLTPIAMQVAMLLRGARNAEPPLPANIMVGLERLELATRRFLKRATVLLDVSRLAAGHRLRPDVSPFNLSTLLAELLEGHAPTAARVHCRLDSAAIEPGIVGEWDRVGVELIIDNLVSNALKYGAGKPVAVGLRTAAERQVQLWVRDEGPGIAAADHDRIFRRFEQALGRRTDSGGFGVGLWVAREVARAMGGELSVQSQLGRGATFSLLLPLDVRSYLAATQSGDSP